MRDRATATLTTLLVDDESLDYLLTPVDKGGWAETIERAGRFIQGRPQKVEPEAAPRLTPQRTKLLVRANNRNFIVDPQDVIYATIDSGLITIVATGIEG